MCKKAAFLLISFCTWNIIKSQLEADNQRLPPYPLHRLSKRKRCRLKGYLSVQQTADKCGVSVRWVNQYILEGRIPGCGRFRRVWAVPEDAVKPKRLTPGVKIKRSSSAQNAARKLAEYFFYPSG
jgi:translation initiation factor IF-1